MLHRVNEVGKARTSVRVAHGIAKPFLNKNEYHNIIIDTFAFCDQMLNDNIRHVITIGVPKSNQTKLKLELKLKPFGPHLEVSACKR